MFSVVAGDLRARETFAMTAKQLIIEYGLDGVDCEYGTIVFQCFLTE